MTISASLVKDLRDLTGAGMMDCKRALEETSGDVEAARQLLREQGIAAAGKRAGRETTEGKVLARIDGSTGTIVAVGTETEPVANNEEFLSFARTVLSAVEAQGPDGVEELEEDRKELVSRLGENIVLRGASRFQAENAEVVSVYVHPPLEKIGVLVRMSAPPDLARRVAMHIAASAPRFIDRGHVPEEELEAERSIYEKLPEVEAKPEDIRPRIVDGMLGKRFYADVVLRDQAWIYDDSKTVGQVLNEEGAEVREFARYALGE